MVAPRAFISEQLLITANNTPGGTGGVYRWNRRVANRAVANVRAVAKVGNPLNNLHRRDWTPGCYKNGFKKYNFGNQHLTGTIVYNDCPHAEYVELGRPSTRGTGNYERYTWSQRPLKIIRSFDGTSGFDGTLILYDVTLATATANGMKNTRIGRYLPGRTSTPKFQF